MSDEVEVEQEEAPLARPLPYVTFDEWLQSVESWCDGQRPGQIFFNSLYVAHPTLANKVRGSYLDPFQSNRKIPQFLNYVADYWEG